MSASVKTITQNSKQAHNNRKNHDDGPGSLFSHVFSMNYLKSLLISRDNFLGFIVILLFAIIPCIYITNPGAKMVLNCAAGLYLLFIIFGFSHFKSPPMTMSECEQLFESCDVIKSIKEIEGEYKGKILSYTLPFGAIAMNGMLLHDWFGKSFYGNHAYALILQRWIVIPTFFKWNLPIIGDAVLRENMVINVNDDKNKDKDKDKRKSVAMSYTVLPITDHFRIMKANTADTKAKAKVKNNGKDILIGVMVVFGYKLMYFTLEKI